MTNLLREFPADSFIGKYLRWARRRTDAPEIFHVGAALTALSSVFAPRVVGHASSRDRPPAKLNLWVGLVGPASQRKTMAASLLTQVLTDPPLPWGDEERKSVERSFEFFRTYPQGVIVEDWDAVLDRLRRPSWSQGHGLLCELHDGTNMSRALCDRSTRGRYREPVVTTIKSPCLSALVTFRGPQKKLPDGVRMLMRRVLWLGGIVPRRTEPMLPKPDGKGADGAFCELARLRRWSFKPGSMLVHREALLAVEEWSHEHEIGGVLPDMRIRAAILRAAALDALGRYETTAYTAHADRMCRVLGEAAIRGTARAIGD